MRALILGAGAGGGLPQWNCGCPNCAAARAGLLPQMTQSSAAVSADGARWAVLNASPDIRQQLADTPALAPRGLRGSPVSDVVLTNGDIDHIAGLLTLREKTPFTIWATPEILAILERDSVFGVLDPALVTRRALTLEAPVEIAGLSVTPFAVPGKIALYLEGETVETEAMGEQTVALDIRAGARRLVYAPGCATLPDWLVTRIDGADALLFDGTLWENEEMPRMGAGEKTGARMGHIAMSGADGSLARLDGVSARRIYIHINNTNPVIQPDGPERAEALRRGWEIGFDGMEIAL